MGQRLPLRPLVHSRGLRPTTAGQWPGTQTPPGCPSSSSEASPEQLDPRQGQSGQSLNSRSLPSWATTAPTAAALVACGLPADEQEPRPSKAPQRLSQEKTMNAIMNWNTMVSFLLRCSKQISEAMLTTMQILTHGDMLTLGDGGNIHGAACMDNWAARNPRFWTQMATFCSLVNNKLQEEDFDEPDTNSDASTGTGGNHHPDTGTWRPSGYEGHDGSSSLESMVAHPDRGDATATQLGLWRGLANPKLWHQASALTPTEAAMLRIAPSHQPAMVVHTTSYGWTDR